jgi:transcriptional regulator with XRE-family HTH domain
MTEKEIGNYVRYYRRLRQLSQQGLAEKTGLSRTSIQRLEAGCDGTSLGVLLKVAGILNLEMHLTQKSSILPVI